MTLQRGDIVLTRFPHAGGNRGKKRPAVIIQADVYNGKLKHFIVAEITKNLAAAADPTSFLIEVIRVHAIRLHSELQSDEPTRA